MTENTPENGFTPSEPFDLTVPQEYLDAISATDSRIDTQMETWQGYIAELQGGANTLQQLQTQMTMLAEPLKRELESHQTLLGTHRKNTH